MSVLLFPEGTDFSDNALAKSDAYADAKGLPCYTRLLHPKTAGFVACVQALGERLDAVYDATVAYTPHPLAAAAADPRPSEHDFPRGTLPRTVLLDVRRVPRAALPAASDEEGLARWLLERWARKEELLVNGLAGEGGEGGEGGPTAPPRASLALEYVAVLLGWMAALGTLRWLQTSPLPWASPTLSSPPSSSPFPSASRSPSRSTPLTLILTPTPHPHIHPHQRTHLHQHSHPRQAGLDGSRRPIRCCCCWALSVAASRSQCAHGWAGWTTWSCGSAPKWASLSCDLRSVNIGPRTKVVRR